MLPARVERTGLRAGSPASRAHCYANWNCYEAPATCKNPLYSRNGRAYIGPKTTLLMRQSTLPSLLFLATGIVFAVASLFTTRSVSSSIDVLVHASYLVIGHVHMLGIAALICVSYSGSYYACARFLHLTIPTGLSLAHFAITLLALIGLGNLHYLGLGHVEPTSYNLLIGILAVNTFTLLLVSGFLFFGIIIVASMLKVRRRRAGI